MDKQTPLSIAQRWAMAAENAYTHNDRSHPDTQTLITRLQAHYGTGNVAVFSMSVVFAIACVEAMNEWQQYKQEADCTCLCGNSLEQHSEATDHTFVDMFGDTTMSGTPYDKVDMP